MPALGIINVVTNQLVPPVCGGNCDECPAIKIYDCAKQLYQTTEQAHTVVEVCESCQIAPATTVKWRITTVYKLCANCNRLLEKALIVH